MPTSSRKSAVAVTSRVGPPAGPHLRVCMSIVCPGTPASVCAARHRLRRVVALWPRAGETELVAAELMTNAIRHTLSGQAGGTFTLTVRQEPGRTMIEVGDLGSARGRPLGRKPPASRYSPDRRTGTAEDGRGLEIVSALADQFGRTAADGPGCNSWAMLNW